ncbi:enhanced serine sensitivity protein SseB [Sporolactobacillus laevolacticus]|uniref:Enhanced serine sensitivity protein SseB n=1 Tax=Sporolactobacillus laevolacticus DSM 442 TaxID=1395513 RepID=V6IW15_9BACL|nr:enhanced serine sensitivity protein SseB [Sporolactobacillus laevolacticus]EST10696.1 hypothetical protein P343_15960 [Sporolactobacillus laevolacticus DSM 442]
MDINKNIKNPRLIDKIEKLQNYYSEENQSSFYKELEKATFLLPAKLIDNNKLNIIRIVDNAGNEYIPAFTDWENLIQSNDHSISQSVVFTLSDYVKILHSDPSIRGIVINAYTQNLVLKRENLGLSNKQKNIKRGESISIGIPKDYPFELVNNLKNFFSNVGYVKSAYLLQMIRNNLDKSILLVIETDNDYNNAFDEIGAFASKFLKEDEVLDLVSLNSDFGQEAIRDQNAFFQKK